MRGSGGAAVCVARGLPRNSSSCCAHSAAGATDATRQRPAHLESEEQLRMNPSVRSAVSCWLRLAR